MAVTLNDKLRVVARMSRQGVDDYINVYNFKFIGPSPVTDQVFMNEIATFLDTQYILINSDIGSSLDYDLIEGLNLTQLVRMPDVLWPTLTAGAGVGVTLPTQTSPCVFWRTLRPKTRASKFLPPYVESTNTGNGTIIAAAITRLQAFGAAFVGALVQGAIDFEYGAYNLPLDRFSPVTVALTPSTFRTQRSRRVGLGS